MIVYAVDMVKSSITILGNHIIVHGVDMVKSSVTILGNAYDNAWC